MGIVPARLGPRIRAHPIGSGPFRFVSSQQDEDVVLERNPDYFGAPPKIPQVRFRIVPDPMMRALELRKGSADLAINSLAPIRSSPSPATASRLHRIRPALRSPTSPSISTTQSSPIAKSVRPSPTPPIAPPCSLFAARPGPPRRQSLAPNSWAYDPAVPHYDYDPEKARKFSTPPVSRPARDGKSASA